MKMDLLSNSQIFMNESAHLSLAITCELLFIRE